MCEVNRDYNVQGAIDRVVSKYILVMIWGGSSTPTGVGISSCRRRSRTWSTVGSGPVKLKRKYIIGKRHSPKTINSGWSVVILARLCPILQILREKNRGWLGHKQVNNQRSPLYSYSSQTKHLFPVNHSKEFVIYRRV